MGILRELNTHHKTGGNAYSAKPLATPSGVRATRGSAEQAFIKLIATFIFKPKMMRLPDEPFVSW